MDALKQGLALLALLAPSPVLAGETSRWSPYVEEAAARFGLPAAWIEQVIAAESGGQAMLAGRPIVSHAGAMGLMQLMPGTWARMRARLALGRDPQDPRDNILAGSLYLRLLYDRFGYPGLFAAYNAGPGRYEAYLDQDLALPAETRAYLAALVAATHESEGAPTGTGAGLAAGLGATLRSGQGAGSGLAAPGGLFFALRCAPADEISGQKMKAGLFAFRAGPTEHAGGCAGSTSRRIEEDRR